MRDSSVTDFLAHSNKWENWGCIIRVHMPEAARVIQVIYNQHSKKRKRKQIVDWYVINIIGLHINFVFLYMYYIEETKLQIFIFINYPPELGISLVNQPVFSTTQALGVVGWGVYNCEYICLKQNMNCLENVTIVLNTYMPDNQQNPLLYCNRLK